MPLAAVTVVHAHRAAAPDTQSRAFAVGVALNTSFVVVEVACGIAAGSVALLSDATHNLGDVLGLALAWAASRLARREQTIRRTYGLRRSTILAALANALLLLGGVAFIAVEAVAHLREGAHPRGSAIIAVAAIGAVVNAGTAALFARGRRDDANVRGAYLHLAADAGVSIAVVAGGVVILLTGWPWIDPVLSLVVSAVVIASAWPLFREALDLALDAVPRRVDPARIERYLANIDGVCAVHDLHIWPLSTTETALTAHLVCDVGAPVDLSEIAHALDREHNVQHTTIQIERGRDGPSARCRRCPR